MNFEDILDSITEIGINEHSKTIINNANDNLNQSIRSIYEIPKRKNEFCNSAIIISAGPSLHRKNIINRIIESKYRGTTICVDGSYISCIKAGLIPNYVLALDPHPKRVVRWFGDHDYEKNKENDDYFDRQDLDIDFRNNSVVENQSNINLVNKFAKKTKAIVSTTVSKNVTNRIKEANFPDYWWNPLVDNPNIKNSITKRLYKINNLPCMNTGGNVGSAAWVFASEILKIKKIALVGMDFGYYSDLPYEKTQTYYELVNFIGEKKLINKCFKKYIFPLNDEEFYTDPTYYWYRKNFFELLKKSNAKTYNCSEGGVLFSDLLECIHLDKFLELYK